MAIWQYKLTILPRAGILKRHNSIPESLVINYTAWENYWEKIRMKNPDAKPNFEDAMTIKWWTGIEVNIDELENRVDRLVAKASYSEPTMLQWKGESKKMKIMTFG